MTKEDNGALSRGIVTDLDCHNSDLKKIRNCLILIKIFHMIAKLTTATEARHVVKTARPFLLTSDRCSLAYMYHYVETWMTDLHHYNFTALIILTIFILKHIKVSRRYFLTIIIIKL
jgi:hypothetical protein